MKLMKHRNLIVVGGLIGLIVVGAVAWYLISPLFIDTTVDEAFPFEAPSQERLAQMTEAEKAEMEADFVAAIPDQAELTKLPEAQRQAVATKVMQAALDMPTHEMDEPMPGATEPAQPSVVLQGQFQDADSFHQGSGSATVYQLPDGAQVLRLEDFSVTNGPDLHVLLATSSAPTSRDDLGEYVDLGSLKGNIGNQNYEIAVGTDVSKFKSVVIYCQPFHVVFATATLG
jgi:hypothetical protein